MSAIQVTSGLRRMLLLAASGVLFLASANAGVFFQEGFNTDGEAATPQRYTTTGRGVYDQTQQVNELGVTTQEGPIYWAHNFEVPSGFVGVPAPTAERRAIMSWHHTLPAEAVTSELLDLFESTVAWLAYNKPGATVCFSPPVNGSGDQVLADRLTAKGYTVIPDDGGPQPPPADVYIHSSSGDLGNPSRFTNVPKGVLTYNALDHDDMLVSSIGSTVTFAPGNATILAGAHPAAGGRTGSFPVLSEGEGTFDLPGSGLPGGATIVAEFIRSVPPTASSLADVDAMIAGAKPSTQATGTASDVDFDVASGGNWDWAAPLPGNPTGPFGALIRGKLRVTAPGRYSFALGVDDGARLRIDTDQNGITEADTIINEDAPGGHRAVYGEATFPAAGTYDFQIVWFNSGGGASLEFNASSIVGGNDRTALGPGGSWELMSNIELPGSNFRLDADAAVTTYVPTGAPELQTLPLLVVLEGPQDGGAVFGGGPFSGFEGAGFFAASGINKWPYPGGQAYRSLTLAPVDVSGRQDVKLTVGLAATFLDFETDDFLELWAYPNGLASTPVRLARYSAPDGATKYFVDVQNGWINQLDLNFRDVTYNIPTGSSRLVIEFRAHTTWWNEIVGFDNLRLSEGAVAPPALDFSVAANGDVILTFGGVLESAGELNGQFNPVSGNPQGAYTLPKANQTDAQRYYRVRN